MKNTEHDSEGLEVFLTQNDCAHSLYFLAEKDGATPALPAHLLLNLMGATHWGRLRRKDLLDALIEVGDAAQEKEIPIVLIKGFHLSQRFYGHIEGRWTRDLDLLIPERCIADMSQLLRDLGYRADAPTWVPDNTGRRLNHAVNWERGDVAVDLHHGLRVRPAYAVDNAALVSESVPISIAGQQIAGLNDGHHFLLIMLGLASDIEQGRVSAKQLMDFSLAARALDDDLDWECWLTDRDKEGLAQVLCAAIGVAAAVMVRSAHFPKLEAAVKRRYPKVPGIFSITSDEAYALLAAPPHTLANRRWLMSHYEGGKLAYLNWWLLGGLFRPGSVGALLNNLRTR